MTQEESVPVIDLAPSFRPDGRPSVVAAIRTACETIGFFAITGHGVPDAILTAARREALEFFALPKEVKMRTPQPPEGISRGYSWVGSRGLAFSLGQKTPPDLQESFAMGPVDAAPADLLGTPFERAFFHRNYWPEEAAPQLQPALEAYYGAMADLSDHILSLFALALDLPADHFAPLADNHTSTMRAILYPAVEGEPAPGQLRAGEHTDYGSLTIVRGDDVPGGLQVRTRAGRWIDVHPPADGFVCNIGDLMMRWTNDHWISNLHRVAVPPPDARKTQRLSLVFFHNPNADAMIETVGQYYDRGTGSRYPAERFGALFLAKHDRAQKMTAATAP